MCLFFRCERVFCPSLLNPPTNGRFLNPGACAGGAVGAACAVRCETGFRLAHNGGGGVSGVSGVYRRHSAAGVVRLCGPDGRWSRPGVEDNLDEERNMDNPFYRQENMLLYILTITIYPI